MNNHGELYWANTGSNMTLSTLVIFFLSEHIFFFSSRSQVCSA
jgi:hypothetical protein